MTATPDSATLQYMSYPGGKAGAGVFQRLINEIPPHEVYVAGFAGHDAIAQFKRPARRNVLIDLDPEPLDWWAEYCDRMSPTKAATAAAAGSSGDAWWEFHHCDAIAWLRFNFGLTERLPKPRDLATVDRASWYRDWFVYLDPPYLLETRSSGPIYKCEMTRVQHCELLSVVRLLPCRVMICGYWSQLYADALATWRAVEYTAVARSGEKRTEFAWCNYPSPGRLHDARFVGGDKREREKVRRRIQRLSRNLSRLPAHERQAVLDAIRSTDNAAGDDGFGGGRSQRPRHAIAESRSEVTRSRRHANGAGAFAVSGD